MKAKKSKIREELILSHLYLVHQLVQKFRSVVSSAWDTEDLISIGTIGLINAVDTYNIEKGTKLSTFAKRKIYGAILDYFRTEDHLSRSTRSKYKKTEEAIRYLEHELGREANIEEVTERLQQSVEEHHSYKLQTQQIFMQDVDEVVDDDGKVSGINLREDSFYNPDNLFFSKEVLNSLYNIISTFSEREKIIFSLYFFEDLSLQRIGLILNLGEPRLSQIVRKIKQNIRRTVYA